MITSAEGIPMLEGYTITHMWDRVYEVWNENADITYRVDLDAKSCTCPHWLHRLKRIKGICKHQDYIKWWGAWND